MGWVGFHLSTRDDYASRWPFGVLTCSILALGFGLTGAGYPYRLLFNYAPGWDGVRVPGRIFTLATLLYALLAGAGAQLLAGLADAWGKRHAIRALGGIVGVVLVVGLVGEGAGHLGHPIVPQPAKAEIGLPGPVLDLPTDGALDRIWQYCSTDGFYKIPIGESTFDIPAIDDLRGGMNGFPDKASVEKLRFYGIKTVVLHTMIPPGLPPEQGWVIAEPPNPAAAAKKPVAGLAITKRQVGSVVIYEIGPGPARIARNRLTMSSPGKLGKDAVSEVCSAQRDRGRRPIPDDRSSAAMRAHGASRWRRSCSSG